MKRLALLLSLLALPAHALADEGMWTLNDFPSQAVEKKYGFSPSREWLEHVRLSSVGMAGGCSGAFVSQDGLVMTNHHCGLECIKQYSTAAKDLVKTGFYARSQGEERKCADIELDQLVSIEDVTGRVQGATSGREPDKFNQALKAEMSRIEKECATDDKLRCDVVSLYQGGKYHLYKYRRFQDVRLVFAPEVQIAFFGGDPDNFNYPRYDLDVTFLRIYDNNQPLRTEHFFKWSEAGAKEGELVFEVGNPGSTQRLLTVAELSFVRDVALPRRLLRLAEMRGRIVEFGRRGKEQERQSRELLFSVENSLKVLSGQLDTLREQALQQRKQGEEQALKVRIARDAKLQKLYGGAFAAIAGVQEEKKRTYKGLLFLEKGWGFSSDLFHIARTLVRAAAEMQKPNEVRLREYRESALPGLKQDLFTSSPIYREVEDLTLSFSLSKLREALGADHPAVRKVLGKESPEDLARSLVSKSSLYDVAARRRLWEGGQKAIEASADPMIKLARLIDEDARAQRKHYEDHIEAVEKKSGELIAKARFAILGASTYPDATGSLRISFGTIKGYEEDGRRIAPFTSLHGAFERATGKPPFDLPQSWLTRKEKLRLATPFNLVCDTDSIGGNSGSPLISQRGEVVGLVFDGNIQSLGGAYWFDPSSYRAVALHSAALVEVLDKVYGARRIVDEILGQKTAQK